MKNLIKPKIKTNWLYIIIIILIAFFIIGGILSYQRWTPKEVEKDQITHSVCLSNNEIADFDYNIDLYTGTGVKLPVNSTTTIYIKNKDTNKELFRFTVSDVVLKTLSLELHKCGAYVIRNFDLDKKKGLYKREELWHYRYDGSGEMLIGEETAKKYLYSFAGFRIDPSESFLSLERAYLDHSDYSIVIKNLKSPNLVDIFSIKLQDIIKDSIMYSGIVGWTRDSKYLWGGSARQTNSAIYFRVNIDTREIDIFEMPEDAIHYDPPRVDNGYIWYVYAPPWTGDYEISEQIYNKWRKEGKKVSLFLYNLFTKEKTILAMVDDPEWNFKTKWLSDTELEYELPTGEKKIYKIEEE